MSEMPEWKKHQEELKRRINEAQSKPEYQARYLHTRIEFEEGTFSVATDALCDVCGQVGTVLVAKQHYDEYERITICQQCLSAAFEKVQSTEGGS